MKSILFAAGIFIIIFLLGLACGISGFGIPDIYPDCFIADDPFGGDGREVLWAADEINPLFKLRFCRTVAAMITGGMLALAGLLLQSILKNPLAEPFILGISGGAAAGAGAMIFTGLAAANAFAVSSGAFAGAVTVLVLVLFMAGRSGSGERILLSGVMVSAVTGALIMIMTAFSNDAGQIAAMTRWMLGDLQTPAPEMLLPAAVTAMLGTGAAMYGAKALNIMSMDRETVFHLGYDPVRISIFFICISALLTSITVAMAGIIGFCGLVVPHTVKKIIGYDHRKNIIPVFLWGGIFLGSCDILSSGIISGKTFPVGVATALTGAPVFLAILNGRRK